MHRKSSTAHRQRATQREASLRYSAAVRKGWIPTPNQWRPARVRTIDIREAIKRREPRRFRR